MLPPITFFLMFKFLGLLPYLLPVDLIVTIGDLDLGFLFSTFISDFSLFYDSRVNSGSGARQKSTAVVKF